MDDSEGGGKEGQRGRRRRRLRGTDDDDDEEEDSDGREFDPEEEDEEMDHYVDEEEGEEGHWDSDPEPPVLLVSDLTDDLLTGSYLTVTLQRPQKAKRHSGRKGRPRQLDRSQPPCMSIYLLCRLTFNLHIMEWLLLLLLSRNVLDGCFGVH